MNIEIKKNDVANNSAQVIQFPANRIVRTVPPEAIQELKEKARVRTVSEEALEICDDLFQELTHTYGVDPNVPDFQRDYMFVVEAIQSMMFRVYGIVHEMHKIVDEAVKFVPAIDEDMQDMDEEDAEPESHVIMIKPIFVIPKNYKSPEDDTKSPA